MPLARPLRTRRAGRVQHVQTARVGLPQGAQRREDRRGTADGTVARRVRGVRAWFVCGGHRQHPVTSFEFRLSFIVSQAVYTYTQIARLRRVPRRRVARAGYRATHTRRTARSVCAAPLPHISLTSTFYRHNLILAPRATRQQKRACTPTHTWPRNRPQATRLLISSATSALTACGLAANPGHHMHGGTRRASGWQSWRKRQNMRNIRRSCVCGGRLT